ncbi:MAG: molybdate ABC transporter substrate-binding protein [Rhodoferax sp.]
MFYRNHVPALRHLAMGLCTALLGLTAQAADILVWSAGAAQTPLSSLIQDYQKASGNTIKVEFAPVGVLLKRLADGGRPDVLIISQDVVANVEKNGWSAPQAAKSIGRVGVGIAIKEGAPVPDISTPAALRQTLLNAKSLTYMDPNKGTSGKHFVSVLEQLGIAEQVKSKTTLGEAGFIVEPVAHGDIELGVQQITEILQVKGAKLVGPLPDTLQKVTTYVITPGAQPRDAAASRDFMAFVTGARAQAVFIVHGFAAP